MVSSNTPQSLFDEFADIENLKLAWRRVRNSMRFETKDWVGTEIYASGQYNDTHLRLIHDRLAKEYTPSQANYFYKPKQDRTRRRFSFLSMDNRIVYQALGNRLIWHSYQPIWELNSQGRLYSSIPTKPSHIPAQNNDFVFQRTFNMTLDRDDESEEKILGQYEQFRKRVLQKRHEYLGKYTEPWLVKTDISSFFYNIDHVLLKSVLCRYLPDGQIVTLLSGCLSKWEDGESKGIPVGYETSDYISNIFLLPIDNIIRKQENYHMVRYVDDMYVFVPDFNSAKHALRLIDDELEKLKLDRNGQKTELICLRRMSEEHLAIKLKKSLSGLETKRQNDLAEQKRQIELSGLLRASQNVETDCEVCCCTEDTFENPREAAFSLYRLTVASESNKEAALCMLDLYPNYGFHAANYLLKNHRGDTSVLDQIRRTINSKHEPTKLRLDCLVAMSKHGGFHMVKDLTDKYSKSPIEWHSDFSISHDIYEKYLPTVDPKILEYVAKNQEHIVPRLYAFNLRFKLCTDDGERSALLLWGLKLAQEYTINTYEREIFEKLIIQYWKEYDLTLNHVDKFSETILSYYVQPKSEEKTQIQHFKDYFEELFSVTLSSDEQIIHIFGDDGDLSHALQLLRNIFSSRERGISKYVYSTYDLIITMLNYLCSQDNLIEDLRELLDVCFSDDSETEDLLENLLLYKKELDDGDSVKERHRGKLKENLKKVFEKHLNTVSKDKSDMFDVFLSYNSQDRQEVKAFCDILKANGCKVWYDRDVIRPGDNWQEKLEEGIDMSNCAIVCIGGSGIGSWQNAEQQVILNQAVSHNKRVIPVLLVSAKSKPNLPKFLANFSWHDLRDNVNYPLSTLIDVIKHP